MMCITVEVVTVFVDVVQVEVEVDIVEVMEEEVFTKVDKRTVLNVAQMNIW